ncbi:medium chain dehydrogenase/reductase family protein [Amnibacterium setariae]|uniref:NADPH:quinone reductase n=1 Tax=Amnibacterium setariae TaxID=2306585 RepID=A0A3A1TW84_9MICO|nr:medium chain dehydrogenase/reductase family protein [Amnibacterium setariae]RIX27811.1 NADPH:quinone reductase [Amnibacterium setariae]
MSTTSDIRIVLPGLVEPEGLRIERAEVPAPAPGRAVVRVEAAGVSFAEQSMRRGRYPGQPPFPFVPGYDLVGRVERVAAGEDAALIGRRVAAATKTGGWATRALVDVADLVPVPDAVEPEAAEAVVVNGITAWQMLVRSARVPAGGTVLVHGASGGVGTVLVQLARARGLRVIGTAAVRHHEAIRALGAEVVDSRAEDWDAAVRRLAPGGVDAVFDHLGITSARRSFRLLRRGGALVAYGTAADRDGKRSVLGVFAEFLAQIALWNALPNGRRASFYDFWGGKRLRPAAFRRRQHEDLAAVLDLVARGEVVPEIAARFPLEQVAEALRLAESRTVRGKVVLLP